MWHHFVNFIHSTWANILRALGTTTLSVILFSFAVPALIWAVTVCTNWFQHRHQATSLKIALKKSILSAIVTGAVTAVAWVVIIGVFLVRTVYEDHNALVQAKASLTSQLSQTSGPKDQEISSLKRQLNATCYMPDRHLTDEQHDALHLSLKSIARKYNHPRMRIGYFGGDTESQRFAILLYGIFKNAGWTMEHDVGHLIERPIHTGKNTDLPVWGYNEGLSFSVPVIDSRIPQTPSRIRQQAIANDVASAFLGQKVSLQTFPTGPGFSLQDIDDSILWVGIKKVDWSQVH